MATHRHVPTAYSSLVTNFDIGASVDNGYPVDSLVYSGRSELLHRQHIHFFPTLLARWPLNELGVSFPGCLKLNNMTRKVTFLRRFLLQQTRVNESSTLFVVYGASPCAASADTRLQQVSPGVCRIKEDSMTPDDFFLLTCTQLLREINSVFICGLLFN